MPMGQPASATTTGAFSCHSPSGSSRPSASRHFSWWATSSGTPALRQRSGSSVHSRSRYNCLFNGHDGGVDTDRDLAVRPLADGFAVVACNAGRRGAAFGERHIIDHPHLGRDQLGDPPSDRQRIPRRLVHELLRTCTFPSGSRSAIGCTGFRRPSSIRPRRQHSPQRRRSRSGNDPNTSATNPANSPRNRFTSSRFTPGDCPPPAEISQRNEALLEGWTGGVLCAVCRAVRRDGPTRASPLDESVRRQVSPFSSWRLCPPVREFPQP